MAAAGSGGGAAFAVAGAAIASANGGVASTSVWVVDQDEFDAHPFTVRTWRFYLCNRSVSVLITAL